MGNENKPNRVHRECHYRGRTRQRQDFFGEKTGANPGDFVGEYLAEQGIEPSRITRYPPGTDSSVMEEDLKPHPLIDKRFIAFKGTIPMGFNTAEELRDFLRKRGEDVSFVVVCDEAGEMKNVKVYTGDFHYY